MEDTQKSTTPTPTISTRLPGGELVELLYDPHTKETSLAVGSASTSQILKAVDSTPHIRLVPWSPANNLIKHQVVLLPSGTVAYQDRVTLLAEIDAYLARYISLTDDLRSIVSLYVLLTWVYDAFNELPYLRFRGDLGSGKTRALLVAGSLCYKAFFASGASTVSPIFHILDAFRGTLILDEADFRFSDEKAELSKILNNGNVRGFPVLRTMMNAKKEFDPRAFNVFGPKIIAMRGNFDDKALESRFITVEMGQQQLDRDVPINLPDTQKVEALCLRNRLLAFRFAESTKTAVDPNLYDSTLSPRGNQVVLPLLSLVQDPSLHEPIKALIRQTQFDTLADRAASPAGQLVALLVEIVGLANDLTISLDQLTTRFIDRYATEFERPITNRYMGSILRRDLHINPYKTHGTYVVPLDGERIQRLAVQYGVDNV